MKTIRPSSLTASASAEKVRLPKTVGRAKYAISLTGSRVFRRNSRLRPDQGTIPYSDTFSGPAHRAKCGTCPRVSAGHSNKNDVLDSLQ
ncbi:hypothetical protein O181_066143 [Austropuccinia psidii MF-1]|uniref:Uncharacterized protein n=1 Tax=Austropuccinia psidii MF-1 TaxID=1389203 RepID=A0A9Q3EQW2_9BASI|nr:hypothetical protein [Austropuccinia psidii MF-1]